MAVKQKKELLRDKVLVLLMSSALNINYMNPIQTLPAVSHLSLPPVSEVVTSKARVQRSESMYVRNELI